MGNLCEDSARWRQYAGERNALKALQGGAKNAAEDYEQALQDTELPSDARALIESKLLPAQQLHIRLLRRLLETETAERLPNFLEIAAPTP